VRRDGGHRFDSYTAVDRTRLHEETRRGDYTNGNIEDERRGDKVQRKRKEREIAKPIAKR